MDTVPIMRQGLRTMNMPVPDDETLDRITKMTDATLWATLTGTKRKKPAATTPTTKHGTDMEIETYNLQQKYGKPARRMRTTHRRTPQATLTYESYIRTTDTPIT